MMKRFKPKDLLKDFDKFAVWRKDVSEYDEMDKVYRMAHDNSMGDCKDFLVKYFKNLSEEG